MTPSYLFCSFWDLHFRIPLGCGKHIIRPVVWRLSKWPMKFGWASTPKDLMGAMCKTPAGGTSKAQQWMESRLWSLSWWFFLGDDFVKEAACKCQEHERTMVWTILVYKARTKTRFRLFRLWRPLKNRPKMFFFLLGVFHSEGFWMPSHRCYLADR